MRTVNVELGDRSYPIYIGPELLAGQDLLKPYIKGAQVCIVSNTQVAPLYLDKLRAQLGEFEVTTLTLPDGEAHKNLSTLNLIFDQLLKDKHNRTSTLIALGGGVVGDMTGFAAASYQRGINFIQVPTTLLSQVDSSVGGKTGVNHPLGKNMIGAFHQPQAVLIDTAVLNTLPESELSAGLAEVIKYGLICDLPFFVWLEENIDRLMARDPEALAYAIERSCIDKASVVEQDEREGGIRAILNLGHTFGHAIELCSNFEIPHGRAVAIGCVMAANYAAERGLCDWDLVDRLENIFNQFDVDLTCDIAESDIWSAMGTDKKKFGNVSS